MISLRTYQTKALRQLRDAARKGHKRQVLCAPTGAGKTRIAAAITQMALERQSRVGFIVDRVELVKQTSQMFFEAGIPHGCKGGGLDFGASQPVTICSAQLLERRDHWPAMDMAFLDECHVQRRAIIDRLQANDVPVIGLTATPFSQGLGRVYSHVVNASSTDNLVREGVLVPVKVFVGTKVDTSGADRRDTEFTDVEASKRVIPVIGSIVSEWVSHCYRTFGEPVRTLVFSATVVDGAELALQFQRAGYRFEQLNQWDSKDDRDRKIADFKAGRITGLISCEVLSRGYDDPGVRCLVSARLYRKSVAAHIQQYGRVMRADPSNPGKTFGLVLDHVGNYLRHADATEAFWASGARSLDERALESIRSRRSKPETAERECYGCGYVMPKGALLCPSCGQARPVRRSVTIKSAGRMIEHKRLTDVVKDVWPHVSALALERHPDDAERALTYARGRYKDIMGRWPNWGRKLTPVAEVHPRVRETVERMRRRYWAARRKR